jgi:SET domain-containing protein
MVINYTESNNSYVLVKDSGIHGKGGFAKKIILKDTIIIEYVGEKISNEEAEKREEINSIKGETYIFDLDDFCIDGADGGNESIYINHSCDPNCWIQKMNSRIFIVAKRDIQAGEELAYDYAYAADGVTRNPCMCRSENCREVIEKEEECIS